MEKMAALNPAAENEADYEAAIDRYIAEMERIVADMAKRERRIEKLWGETDTLLAGLKVA